MLEVTENELKNRLRFDNPWWDSGTGIPSDYQEMPRRDYFDLFLPLAVQADVRRAAILLGPRRVGKTVLIYHVIQHLIESGVEADRILYLSLDTPVYNGVPLERLLGLFSEIFHHQPGDRLFIFFDEIQYFRDWEIHLKSLVDSYRNLQFVASGSAAAALRMKSRESGAGRFTDFFLPPLTFAEFLRFKGLENSLIDEPSSRIFEARNIAALNLAFVDYLNFGGFPEAVFSETISQDPARFIRHDIIDKVLLRDLPSIYGITDVQELNQLFTTLAYNTANEMSYPALSRSAGVAKNTIKKYLEYLEAAFLIRRIRRVDKNARKFQRETGFKTYLNNPSMRAALFGPVKSDDDAMGQLVETAIFGQWFHAPWFELRYAKWKKGEVDLVAFAEDLQRPNFALEVKWTDRFFTRPGELKSLAVFLQETSVKNALVTTRTISGFKDVAEVSVRFVPAAVYCYTLGRNILTSRSKDADIGVEEPVPPGGNS